MSKRCKMPAPICNVFWGNPQLMPMYDITAIEDAVRITAETSGRKAGGSGRWMKMTLILKGKKSDAHADRDPTHCIPNADKTAALAHLIDINRI